MSNKCKYCGKEFDTPQKLGGHIPWCENNPDLEKSKERLSKARDCLKLKYKEKLIHKGEKCECQYCHNLYALYGLKNHEQYCNCNPNKKEHSKKYKLKNQNKTSWKTGLTKETSEKVKAAAEKLKERYKNGDLTPAWSGKHHTEKEKEQISVSLKKYYEIHPEEIGYKIHHSSNISYPEQYFKDVFKQENIPLKYHLQVGLYELDFYNEEYKFYVEIDGGTHKQKKVQEIDKRKDEYLQSLGWKGMRIEWDSYQRLDYNKKHNIINEIKCSCGATG